MRPIWICLTFLFLGGCSVGGVATPVMWLEGASVVATDKTIGDHIISYSQGKNCSTVRKEKGLTYCEEDEIAEPEEVYCYRTLGNVTCYNRPAHGTKYETLGHIPEGSPPIR